MKPVFVLGCLAAVMSVMLWVNFSTALDSTAVSDETRITLEENAKSILIKVNDREILNYCCQESPKKPYLRNLCTPQGVQILRDSPSDHKHHHALMFAVTADNVDFWSEGPNNGLEKSLSIESPTTKVRHGLGQAEFTQKLSWIDPKTEKPIVQESRRIVAFASPNINATLLSWHATLEPAAGKESVTLGGSHYFGLGMRFIPSMDAAGEFVTSDNKEGEAVRGSEKLTPARWCAYRSQADGKPVTVAIFDSPKNPRHPNKFFTMRPFAYLAATLNLWKEPMTIKAGKPLRLTYGVVAWDGRIDAADIEKTYERWTKLEAIPQSQEQ
jgi:hypothetical protein